MYSLYIFHQRSPAAHSQACCSPAIYIFIYLFIFYAYLLYIFLYTMYIFHIFIYSSYIFYQLPTTKLAAVHQYIFFIYPSMFYIFFTYFFLCSMYIFHILDIYTSPYIFFNKDHQLPTAKLAAVHQHIFFIYFLYSVYF